MSSARKDINWLKYLEGRFLTLQGSDDSTRPLVWGFATDYGKSTLPQPLPSQLQTAVMHPSSQVQIPWERARTSSQKGQQRPWSVSLTGPEAHGLRFLQISSLEERWFTVTTKSWLDGGPPKQQSFTMLPQIQIPIQMNISYNNKGEAHSAFRELVSSNIPKSGCWRHFSRYVLYMRTD